MIDDTPTPELRPPIFVLVAQPVAAKAPNHFEVASARRVFDSLYSDVGGGIYDG